MKVAVVFGTRPEAIKLCPVIREFERTADVDVRVCVTGQHRELLDSVLEIFEVRPHVDLALMRPAQSLASLTSRAIEALSKYFEEDKPDGLIVQGDTTSAFTAALAAFYSKIPVFHVEAGLRTGHKFLPFPEEVNRSLITRLADLHFCPTTFAAQALAREGIPGEKILVTGNPIVEAVKQIDRFTEANQPNLPEPIAAWGKKPLVIITTHRRETFGQGLIGICNGIRTLARNFPNTGFAYFLHPNPEVGRTVTSILSDEPNVMLTPPLDYPSFLYLLKRAQFLLSDSGGVQEEATVLGTKVLVLREVTERQEAVAAGFAQLVGLDPLIIVEAAGAILSRPNHAKMEPEPVFGDGTASQRIVDAVCEYIKPADRRNASVGSRDELRANGI